MKKTISALMISFLFWGCSLIRPAPMVQPADFQVFDVIPVTGVGGWAKGQYEAGIFRGSFSRSSDHLTFFGDPTEERSGKVEFTVTDPKIEGTLEAQCRMRERAINIGTISFNSERMAYRCEFTNNTNAIPARFEIQGSRHGLAGALQKEERRGEIALDRVILQITSVHKLQGIQIELPTPIGYRFELNGNTVGSVELNGKPVIRISPRADDATRRAIVVASIALGVFWDPANSAD